jgi:hypothetical protein
VKSEFVRVEPTDGLIYFWWAFLRSPEFLDRLPTGTGGTRPRLSMETLLATPVDVPQPGTRTQIHTQLRECAMEEWRAMFRRRAILALLENS